MKEMISENVISESEPLNRLFEEKNTRETVGDVSVHTGVRLQIVDTAENILILFATSPSRHRHSDVIHSFLESEMR